jgi:hypothetical protein
LLWDLLVEMLLNQFFVVFIFLQSCEKIIANGSSITFNDTSVIFVTVLGGKTNTHHLKIVSKELTKIPPTYNCTGKIGDNYSHQFKVLAKKNIVVWNSIKVDKTLVERFLFIKQDENQ